MENWQSEFLQFSLYILATIWLIQRGSSESKQEHEAGLQSDEEQQVGSHASAESPRWARVGDWRTTLYSHSLLIAMTTIFFLSWFAQSLNGWDQYNANQHEHGQTAVAWTTYLHQPDFWDATLQNWQSEFLAVGTMAVFSVYLRHVDPPRASPSVPLHAETGAQLDKIADPNGCQWGGQGNGIRSPSCDAAHRSPGQARQTASSATNRRIAPT